MDFFPLRKIKMVFLWAFSFLSNESSVRPTNLDGGIVDKGPMESVECHETTRVLKPRNIYYPTSEVSTLCFNKDGKWVPTPSTMGGLGGKLVEKVIQWTNKNPAVQIPLFITTVSKMVYGYTWMINNADPMQFSIRFAIEAVVFCINTFVVFFSLICLANPDLIVLGFSADTILSVTSTIVIVQTWVFYVAQNLLAIEPVLRIRGAGPSYTPILAPNIVVPDDIKIGKTIMLKPNII